MQKLLHWIFQRRDYENIKNTHHKKDWEMNSIKLINLQETPISSLLYMYNEDHILFLRSNNTKIIIKILLLMHLIVNTD